eukprot:jgi/Orpsp1_1/1189828/evm.model.d7180000074784.1
MNCIAIDSNRDPLGTDNQVTYLNIEDITKSLLTGMRYKVTSTDGNVIYKCKLSKIRRETHKITDANNKTIAKFKLMMNEDKTGFNLMINTKNNIDKEDEEEKFNKNDYICVNVQPREETKDNTDVRKYMIRFYNKAIDGEDIIELEDRSYTSNNNNSGTVFDYKIYHGRPEYNSPILCNVGQSYSFNLNSTIDIQPGVEPLFMIILHVCIYILNSFRNNNNIYTTASLLIMASVVLL